MKTLQTPREKLANSITGAGREAILARQAAASHSPLPDAKRPWHNDPSTFGTLTDESLKNVISRMDAHLTQVMSERDSLKAHAQRLADALAKISAWALQNYEPNVRKIAEEALAQWEKDKQ